MRNILDFLSQRAEGSKQRLQDRFLRGKWSDGGEIYKKVCICVTCSIELVLGYFCQDLLAHYGCVNAVEFSDDGDLMVTGGDDKRVLLWSLDRAITSQSGGYKPVTMTGQHESNIFCLDFDGDNSMLFSGGNDASVIVHDVNTTKPLEFFRHEEPVYGLSVCPVNSDLFLTACSDGRVLQYDLRQRRKEEPVLLAGYSHAFHAVQYNPCEPRLVVTSNQKMGLGLWDVRKPGTLVLGYGGAGGVTQTSMYVRWNSRGDRILGLRRRSSLRLLLCL